MSTKKSPNPDHKNKDIQHWTQSRKVRTLAVGIGMMAVLGAAVIAGVYAAAITLYAVSVVAVYFYVHRHDSSVPPEAPDTPEVEPVKPMAGDINRQQIEQEKTFYTDRFCGQEEHKQMALKIFGNDDNSWSDRPYHQIEEYLKGVYGYDEVSLNQVTRAVRPTNGQEYWILECDITRSKVL